MAKTIEETYQKKTPKEHILLRPDTYIGSVEMDTQSMYIWDDLKQMVVLKSISFVPGLYKIFDEILVNAADNKIRDPSMTIIKVDISESQISVYNNGRGIPIEIHSKEKVYVPELIFGHLLTSSNYDDKEKKVTGGRNGYGAKLCNIFSKEFIIETSSKGQKYFQRFADNMSIIEPPKITSGGTEEYTKITFTPDFKRFSMEKLDKDVIGLLKKRVYDMCGTVKNIKVHLNGAKLKIRNFVEYVKLYIPEGQKIVHRVINSRWELACTISDEQFMHVSFVNSISTAKGGTHVNHVIDQLVEPISNAIKKKDKSVVVKPLHVKNSLFIFMNCLIENPSFDSQTKENLTLKASSFGSKCLPIDDFVKDVIKGTEIIERIITFSKAKQAIQLKKTDGVKTTRLTGIAKLEDASLAGTKKSGECTIILTEGDSAKTLVVAGLGVVGREKYGVFPLRGKLLNVREASHTQIVENVEISNVKKILGLQHGKVYTGTSSLRYGHIMIMTDQDHDGSHIKGLIINFLDHFFPSLLKIPGFLQEFITPIIRATRRNETKDFFTIPEYESFKEQNEADGITGWSIKYYKGLGTSTPKDAKYYFSNLDIHVKNFMTMTDSDKELIDLAFNKKKADNRKTWLSDFEPGTYLDQSVKNISITDFVNRELILFSTADNVRSIPSVIDGFKPGQRKVIFSCFKRNLKSEIKVAQLVGYVSEHSAYHHGEQSLCMTIINLAHDFVGSNNINLLLPLGSFGSRLQGGKDAASPRYIYTNLNPITRLIFNEFDDPVLKYNTEDNLKIEPEYYVPIIPMVLVNGADGIGTGWSTNIPNYNPLDIIRNIRNLIQGKKLDEMTPWYRNFRGEIVEQSNNKFVVNGIAEKCGADISIMELPVGTWTQNYKEYLEASLSNGTIKHFKESFTEKIVDFLVSPVNAFNLKLSTSLSISNMVCFDRNGKIKKYSSPLEIITEFYYVRLEYYQFRKDNRLATLRAELVRAGNKARFIKAVTSGKFVIHKRPTAEIVHDLEKDGYERLDDFEYLLGMKISSLTKERMERIIRECEEKKIEYDNLEKKQIKEMWTEDLDVFEAEFLKIMNAETKEYDRELKDKIKNRSKATKSNQRVDLSSKSTGRKTQASKSGTAKGAKNPSSQSSGTKKGKNEAVKKELNAGSGKSESSKRSKKTVVEKQAIPNEPPSESSEVAVRENFVDSSSESNGSDEPWVKYKNIE